MASEHLHHASPQFVNELQCVLQHLYDPIVLRESPLLDALSGDRDLGPAALRDLLQQAIEALRPELGMRKEAGAWRAYRALRHRFVDTQEPPLRGNSFYRYQAVVQALERTMGRIDVPFAQRLMTTHAGILDSLCRHPSEFSQVSTISTSIFLPAQRTMLFCNGLPCQGRYDKHLL